MPTNPASTWAVTTTLWHRYPSPLSLHFIFLGMFVSRTVFMISSTVVRFKMCMFLRCMQVPWHDGTVKNVHVDPGMLIVYRKRLLKALKLYSERIRFTHPSVQLALCPKRLTTDSSWHA